MDLVSFGGSGGFAVSISPGESELFSSISFFLPLSLSPSPLNSLSSPHVTLSSLLLQNGPKSSFWVQGWSGFMGPLPICPIPPALALGKGWWGLISSGRHSA